MSNASELTKSAGLSALRANYWVALLVGLAAACAPTTNPAPATPTHDAVRGDSLFGRRARIVYPQFTAEVTYTSPAELHWKTTAPDGTVAEGHEKPVYQRLSDHQHFLSWIEQDGFTVSQVIDTQRLMVVGYGSYADESSQRGHRSGNLLEGTLTFTP
jgi:hypothetical protein